MLRFAIRSALPRVASKKAFLRPSVLLAQRGKKSWVASDPEEMMHVTQQAMVSK